MHKKIFYMLLCLFLFSSLYAQIAQDYTEAFQKSLSLEKQKEFFKAIEVLKNIEVKYSQDYTLNLQIAWLYFQSGLYKEAKGYYQKAIALAYEPEQAYLGYAWSAYYLKEYEEAISYFEKVLAKLPGNKGAKEGLSYSLKAQYQYVMNISKEKEVEKQPWQGAQILEPLRKRYPKDYSVHLRSAWLYFLGLDYTLAEKNYRIALNIAPNDLDAAIGLAWSLLYLGKYEEAESIFSQFSKQYPENQSAQEGLYRSRSALYEKKGDFLQAAQSLEVVLTKLSKDETLRFHLASLQFQAGQYEKAEGSYRRVLQIYPQSADAKIGLAWCLLYLGKYEEAQTIFSELLKEYPENQSAQEGLYRSRSVLYEKKGDLAQAGKNLEHVAKKYPKDEKLVLYYAWLEFQSKNYEKAQVAYEIVLQHNPHSLDAKTGLAWCLYYQNEWEESEQHFRNILETSQENAAAKQGLKAINIAKSSYKRDIKISASLAYTALDYDSDHKIKEDGYSVTGNIGITLFEYFSTSMTLRGLEFSTKQDLVPAEDFDSTEIYLSTGLNFASFGVLFHYGRVKDESDSALQKLDAFGATLRWSNTLGDFSIESNFCDYEYTSDMQRYAIGWFSYEIIPSFHLQLGASFQRTDHENFYNGSMTLYYYIGENITDAKWLLWLGGKYGDEFKPAYLGAHSIYNIIEEIEYGLNAGVQYNFGSGLKAFFAFECLYINVDKETPILQEINGEKQIIKIPFDYDSYSFSFTLGISYSFF